MKKPDLGVKPTEDQAKALDQIMVSIQRRRFHLLTGYAGSGKTTLMQILALAVRSLRLKVALTAPTHKAVAVLRRRLRVAGITDIPCLTIHSLLSLSPSPDGERMVFERRKIAEPIEADVVIVDECSMVQEDLMRQIKRHLSGRTVIFVGDPAQLPPVGEVASQSFAIEPRSHLEVTQRQAAGSPIWNAADIIRRSQGAEQMDWSWCRPAKSDTASVFCPAAIDPWLKKAFTSDEFAADADSFRYVAWTNARVADVNSKVRCWLYGDDIPTPFMPGERAMLRAPLVIDKEIVLATNEEVQVLDISEGESVHHFERTYSDPRWSAVIPTWEAKVRSDDGMELDIHFVRDDQALKRATDRLAGEAAEARERWRDFHAFKGFFVKAQSVYAMTVHNSQGSTLKHCFVDVHDIRRRVPTNPLEAKQLYYVALTRPTHAAMLVGLAT